MLHWMLWSPQCLQVPIAGICPSCRSPEPTSHGNGWVAHGFTNLGGTNMYKLTDFLKGQHNVDTTLYPQTHTGLKISKQKCQRQSPTLSNLDQVVTFPLLCRAAKASEQETTCRTSLEYGWKLFKSSWLQAKYCMSCGEAWMALQNITWHLAQAHWGALQLPYCLMRQAPMNFCRPPASWPKRFETQLKASTRHNHRPWSIAPNDHITWAREEWTGQIVPAWSSFKKVQYIDGRTN